MKKRSFVINLASEMLDFNYEISNEEIDGKKATVDMNFTTHPKNILGQLLTKMQTIQ